MEEGMMEAFGIALCEWAVLIWETGVLEFFLRAWTMRSDVLYDYFIAK